jgi:hypothetical protein
MEVLVPRLVGLWPSAVAFSFLRFQSIDFGQDSEKKRI